jgi:catechol 2,3-dioxygenase-like lactoylglutathione lyase family enzyme
MLFLVCLLWGAGGMTLGADSRQPIVESLGHVGVTISDEQAALHFYIDQLGLTEAFRVNRPDGSTGVIYLRVADTNSFLELFRSIEKSAPAGTTSGYHVCLLVKDLQATLHTLKERGYPLPDDAFEKAKKDHRDHTLMYKIQDPDGNSTELMQLLPNALQITSRNKQ